MLRSDADGRGFSEGRHTDTAEVEPESVNRILEVSPAIAEIAAQRNSDPHRIYVFRKNGV